MDLETDTHIPTVIAPKPELSFIIPQEFIDLLVAKVTQSVLDTLANNTKVDDYINDSISEWMKYEFNIDDHLDHFNTDEIVDKVCSELESRIEVESTISIR